MSNRVGAMKVSQGCIFFTMYIKIKSLHSVADKFGNNIVITKIGLYENNGKWVKLIKLNEYTQLLLEQTKIDVSHINLPNE